MSDFIDGSAAKKKHDEIQEQFKTDPKLANAKLLSESAQSAVDSINQDIFSEDAFEREARLRNWVRSFFEDQRLNISDAEDFLSHVKAVKASQIWSPGKALYFMYLKKIL